VTRTLPRHLRQTFVLPVLLRTGRNTCITSLPLIAEHDAATVRTCAVLPQKDALPSAQAKAPIDEGDHFRRTRQCHLNVARHIVWPFINMRKIGIILRDEAVYEALEISACRWIGVFHNHQTTTGMTAKDSHRAVTQAGLAQARLNGRGEFFGRFPWSRDF
jgi:hypothetical protein